MAPIGFRTDSHDADVAAIVARRHDNGGDFGRRRRVASTSATRSARSRRSRCSTSWACLPTTRRCRAASSSSSTRAAMTAASALRRRRPCTPATRPRRRACCVASDSLITRRYNGRCGTCSTASTGRAAGGTTSRASVVDRTPATRIRVPRCTPSTPCASAPSTAPESSRSITRWSPCSTTGETREPLGPCRWGIGTQFLRVEYPFLRFNLFFYVYVLSFYARARSDPRFAAAVSALEAKLDEAGRLVVERPHPTLRGLAFCARGEPSALATARHGEIRRNLTA